MTLLLNVVYSIHQTKEEGVLLLKCNITDLEGAVYDCDYVSRPEDGFGLNPLIREWLDEHPEFPREAYVPPPPPTEQELREQVSALTARQLRLGLLKAGISPSTVTVTLAAMPAGPDRDEAQIEWEYATTFNRMHPLIATVGAALDLTDTQIDTMWNAAISL